MTSDGTSSSQLRSMQLNAKAGMEGLDTEKINDIIREASRGSNYYRFQQKRQQHINEKIQEIKKKLSILSHTEIEESTRKMNELGRKMENSRNLNRIIVHVDMDAFYAAVEIRDDPSLENKPMAVGCQSMLSTSNYIARRFGVRAAMPGFIALKLCPHLQIVPPNFNKYHDVSLDVQEVFREYDPDFNSMSLDEAYLDITDVVTDRWSSESTQLSLDQVASQVVEEMRLKIFEKTSLTASAGIAPNLFLAKVCSDQNKPNGQFQIAREREAIMAFVEKLPVRKVSGVGNVTEQLLNSIGVITCTDLWEKRGVINLIFSPTASHSFLEISRGLGSNRVKWDAPRKSMSVERTFDDTSDNAILQQWCLDLSEELAKDLREEQLTGKTITLKLKTSKFVVKTKCITLPYATADCKQILAVARNLLSREINSATNEGGCLKLRLMGIRMSSLVSSDVSTSGNKKQCTLEDLFTKCPMAEDPSIHAPELAGEGFICPICNKVGGRNLRELNFHVNKCIAIDDDDSHPTRGKNQPTLMSFKDDILRTKVEQSCSSNLELLAAKFANESSNSHIFTSAELASGISKDSEIFHKNVAFTTETCTNNQNESAEVEVNGANSPQILEANVPDNDNVAIVKTRSSLNDDLDQTLSETCRVICPVCEQSQIFESLEAFNQHVDVCLNRKAIKNILHSDSSSSTGRKSSAKVNGKRKRSAYVGSMEKFILKAKK